MIVYTDLKKRKSGDGFKFVPGKKYPVCPDCEKDFIPITEDTFKTINDFRINTYWRSLKMKPPPPKEIKKKAGRVQIVIRENPKIPPGYKPFLFGAIASTCDCGYYNRVDKFGQNKKDQIEQSLFDQSGIPRKYIEFDYSIDNDYIKSYINNITRKFNKSEHLFIYGLPGRRKTTYACMILKGAIKKGMSAAYVKSLDLSKYQITREKLDFYKRVHFLVIDDLAAFEGEGKSGNVVSVIDSRDGDQLVTILITNAAENFVINTFEFMKDDNEGAFESRLKRFKLVEVTGEDYRSIE